MKHMNSYDLAFAERRFAGAATPNRYRLVEVVSDLAYWTDMNSDGWAHWSKPRAAAQRAISLIESTTNAANGQQERVDITDAELTKAITPIKAFLTRHGAESFEEVVR